MAQQAQNEVKSGREFVLYRDGNWHWFDSEDKAWKLGKPPKQHTVDGLNRVNVTFAFLIK
jgi:hypothetical protein